MITFEDIQHEINCQEPLPDDIDVSSWDYFKSRDEDEDDIDLFTVSWN